MRQFSTLFSSVSSLLATAAITATVFTSTPAHAYYATLDNGEVLKEGEYQAMISPQLIFNQFDGANFTGRLDTGLMEGVSGRALLGFGKIDFQIGGMLKWMPFPDTDSQPAIGSEAGIIFARIGSINQYSIRLHPIVSKRIETEIGDVIPYGSLPFGITVQSGGGDETFMPAQLVAGTELRPLEMKNWSFFGELGVNLTKSFGYASVALAYRFDGSSFGTGKQ